MSNFGDERVDQRFWLKLTPEPNTSCWLWTGAQSRGYGRVLRGGAMWQAHRWVYERLVGPVASELQLDHLCRTRCCCNPDHLEPVTPRANTLRGVGATAANARKVLCAKGHPLGPTRKVGKRFRRDCRVCRLIWSREADARRRPRRAS